MNELTHNGQDDYLPDSALDKILELTESMSQTFDVGSTQAYSKSIQANIKFPVEGPIAQMKALEQLLLAATMLGTTARNLRHEREQANPVYTKIRICHHHMSTVQGEQERCDYWHAENEGLAPGDAFGIGDCEDIRERRVIIE